MELSTTLIALFLSVCSLALSIHTLRVKRGTHKRESRDALGKKYAEMAWIYAKAQPEASDPAKLRRHAEQAFVIADKAADGKRDFSNAQAAVYLNASPLKP